MKIGSRYEIIDEAPVGRGASGTVYRGQGGAGDTVAIKVLNDQLADDPDVVVRFTQERRILSGVRDPHVVAVRDLVAEGDLLAIVMEFVDGPTLKEWIATTPEVTAEDVARIGSDIARGLAALHAADVVHRDLKPANVLLDGAGEPRITDFGISALLDDDAEKTSALGTPLYIAPEVLRLDPVTAASDVYALGLIMYEMASGVPAFSGSTRQIAKAHLELMPGRLEYLPPALWDVIESALGKDPSTRPSAGRMAARLERLRPDLADRPALPRLSVPPVPQVAVLETPTRQLTTQAIKTMALTPESMNGAPPEPSRETKRSAPLPAVLASLAVLIALGAVVLMLFRSQQVASDAPSAAVTATQTVSTPTKTVTAKPDKAALVPTSLELCDLMSYPFRTPISTYNAGTTLAQAQASGDAVAIRRATAMASIQAAWRDAGETGPTNGKAFAPLGDFGPQSTMLISQIQDAEGMTPTGQIDATTWNVLQQWYC